MLIQMCSQQCNAAVIMFSQECSVAKSFEQWPEHFSLAVIPYTQVYKSNIDTKKLLVQCDGVLVGSNMQRTSILSRERRETFSSLATTLVQAQIYLTFQDVCWPHCQMCACLCYVVACHAPETGDNGQAGVSQFARTEKLHTYGPYSSKVDLNIQCVDPQL